MSKVALGRHFSSADVLIFQGADFPPISIESVHFLSLGAQGERRAKEFLPPDEAIRRLTKLRKQYTQQPESFKPIRYAVAPENRRYLTPQLYLAILYHDHLVSSYINEHRDFERWSVGLADDLITFLTASQRTAVIEARCCITKFSAHVVGNHDNRPFRFLREEIGRMRKYLAKVIRFPAENFSDQYLRVVLSRAVQVVDVKADWVPMTDFDSEFIILAEATGMGPELAELAYSLKAGNKGAVMAYVKNFGRRFDLKASDVEAFIVLKHAVLRYLFDFLFVNKMTFPVGGQDQLERFFERCAVIASCSPRSLGIPDHLLTPGQLDPALLTLVKKEPSIAQISAEIAALQFYNAPTDVLFLLQGILQKLDELARDNTLTRKSGGFTAAVGKAHRAKKMSFMSFDDCFSLFFAIFAVDPPRNALAVCESFNKLPDLSSAAAAKYARATFVTAVQHITDFSMDQLVVEDKEAQHPSGVV
jgi:hypothetical protein